MQNLQSPQQALATLETYLDLLDPHNHQAAQQLLQDHHDRLLQAPGSAHKHQAFVGGYLGHLAETCMLAETWYAALPAERVGDFALADVVLVLFLHDIEKPWKYVEPKTAFADDQAKDDFRQQIITDYGFELDDMHRNALQYIHGEGDEHNPSQRVMGPLATFCHICDVASARMWFDWPHYK